MRSYQDPRAGPAPSFVTDHATCTDWPGCAAAGGVTPVTRRSAARSCTVASLARRLLPSSDRSQTVSPLSVRMMT